MAGSRSLEGARPVCSIWACCVSFQLLLDATSEPLESNRLMVGSARKPETPNCANVGPSARNKICLLWLWRIKPAIKTSFLVAARARVEMLESWGPAGGVEGAPYNDRAPLMSSAVR